MPKGRHRRHRQARQLKLNQPPATSRPEPCIECARVGAHADWCLAEADLGDADEPVDVTEDDRHPGR